MSQQPTGVYHPRNPRDSSLYAWQNGYRCVVALMRSNLSEAQSELLVSAFEMATFLLDPDEAGQKLKCQVVKRLLRRMPVWVIETAKQVDQMTTDELRVILTLKAA